MCGVRTKNKTLMAIRPVLGRVDRRTNAGRLAHTPTTLLSHLLRYSKKSVQLAFPERIVAKYNNSIHLFINPRLELVVEIRCNYRCTRDNVGQLYEHID